MFSKTIQFQKKFSLEAPQDSKTSTEEYPSEVKLFSLKLVREGKVPFRAELVNKPSSSANIISKILRSKDREHLVVVALDTKLYPVGINITHIGTLNSTLVSPREVFKFALLSNAAAVILGHNHPSGILDPSTQDLDVTKTLIQIGKSLDIPVYDHIIVAPFNKGWISLRTTHPSLFI